MPPKLTSSEQGGTPSPIPTLHLFMAPHLPQIIEETWLLSWITKFKPRGYCSLLYLAHQLTHHRFAASITGIMILHNGF